MHKNIIKQLYIINDDTINKNNRHFPLNKRETRELTTTSNVLYANL